MQNQKFNVGDSVRVVGCQNGIVQMEKLVGNTCTILEINGDWYTLKEDPVWLWSEAWLEFDTPEFQIDEYEFEQLWK